MKEHNLTLLSEGQIWGNCNESQLEVIRKYGIQAAITDLCILTGSYLCEDNYNIGKASSLFRRTGWFWTKSDDGDNDVRAVHWSGEKFERYRNERSGVVRPVLQSSKIFFQVLPNRTMGYNRIEEVEYGEYPQNAPDFDMQRRLENEYQRGMLQRTSRGYTFDKNDDFSRFQPVTYEEYEYNGKRYIRVEAKSSYGNFKLSNGKEYKNGDYVWVEVSPVKWLIDDRTNTLVSKIGLLAGIKFDNR